MLKRKPTQILAIFIFLYSCTVMAGWIWDADALTAILPIGISMQFITAFAFFISSIALWSIDLAVQGKREIPQLILPATATLTLLIITTLSAAGIIGITTGISDLFIEGNSIKGSVVPGMPAIPEIISFILFSIASILVIFPSPKLGQKLLFLGIPIILIGLIACFGYLSQIPFLYYKISPATNPIALNTAILFVLLGFGMILTGRSQEYENKS